MTTAQESPGSHGRGFLFRAQTAKLFRFAGACLRAARYASPDGLSRTPGLHPTTAGDVASVAFLDTGWVLLSVRGRDRGKGRHEARGYESNSNFHITLPTLPT